MAANSTLTAKKRGPGRPFRPGQSGNPEGRPKQAAEFGALIREYLASKGPKNKTRMQEIVERLYTEDPKTLLAYGYGKPTEMIAVASATDAKHTIDPEVLELARAVARGLDEETTEAN